MSRYAVNKVLWQVARDDDAAARYMDAPEAFLAGRPLTEVEHRQLVERDLAGMFAAGAHPFLLYTFNIKVAGFSFQMMTDYVKALAGVEVPLDIST